MKKSILIAICFTAIARVHGQNGVYVPIGLYGNQYAATTSIGSGGSIIVGSSGIWKLGGDIVSADKGNSNTPNAIGRTEKITFNGTGSYNNAAIVSGATSGTSGYIIDGYAGASSQSSDFILPIGSNAIAYPVTIPANANVTAAFFEGSGSIQNTAVNGNSAVEFSPYIDMTGGVPTGNYSFSYPSGFLSGTNSWLLHSNNSSAAGTSGSTIYSLLAGVTGFSTSGGIVSASVNNALTTTQIYFSISSQGLPITLKSFTVVADDCDANIMWSTSTEIGISYYAVERSNDGINFEMVGRVSSSRIEETKYNFNYTGLSNGIAYFRIKIISNNGEYIYSTIKSVKGACSVAMPIVYPNPVSDILHLEKFPYGCKVILSDVTGRQLRQFSCANNSNLQLDVSELMAGVYFINIQSDNGLVKSFKFFRQ